MSKEQLVFNGVCFKLGDGALINLFVDPWIPLAIPIFLVC